MTALVILPGLDGDGSLRVRFADALGAGITPVLVSYPTDRELGYADLVPFVESVVARHERYVLLGESFSGPLACLLAAGKPDGLVGLVLCATFADAPRAMYRWTSALIDWIPYHRVPRHAASWLLFNAWSGVGQSRQLEAALDKVALAVLRKRAIEAASVDVRSQLRHIDVPVLCLRAGSDRVVSQGASERLCAGLSGVEVVTIDGPHALLQAIPEVCASHVSRFVRAVAGS